jgi:HK97 family phage portal protein
LSFADRVRKLFQPETKSGVSSPEDWLFEAFGAQPSAAGINVSPATAIKCAPVRAAITVISENIASLPVHLYRKGANGERDRVNNHPVEKLLSGTANEFTASNTLRENMTAEALLLHGAFAFVGRNSEGKPVELFQLPASTVTVESDAFTGPRYKVAEENGKSREIPRANILHLPSPSLSGKGLIHDARDIVGLSLVLERYASKLFANAARPSGVLSLKGNATPDALLKAKTAWTAAHAGDKAGGTAVIPGDAEWSPMTMTSTDAQFLELRTFSINEVARYWNISPLFLQEFGRQTWGNAEQSKSNLLSVTLLPWIRRWEAALNLTLLTDEERAAGFYIEVMTEGFVAADYAAKTEGINKLIASRVINPNEARAMMNLPLYAGGDQFINPNVTPGAAQ